MHYTHDDQQGLLCSSDAALYDRYGGAIFAYVRLNTASREDAEDLTLEVFTLALEQGNLLRQNEKEQLAWLRRVAHNKIVDNYRRAHRHPRVALEVVQELLPAEHEQEPEQLALRQERIKELQARLDQLPELQRQVLQLRYGAELSFAEIAKLLGKRETAIRQMLSRALTSLRTLYQKQQL